MRPVWYPVHFLMLFVVLLSGAGDLAFAQAFVSPVGPGFVVTRGFMAQVGTQRHTGVDLADGTEGGDVHAIGPGMVVYKQESTDPTGWGYMIRIRHTLDGRTFYSQYGHMQAGSLLVNVGDVVTGGQLIGKVDCTGNTDGTTLCSNGKKGPHIHLEIKLLDDAVATTNSGNGCGYLPSANCPGDSFAHYFDPLPFISGQSLYVTSFAEGRIYKVDKKSAAKISVASGFSLPEDMTTGSNGTLYIGGVFQGVKRFDTLTNSRLSDVGSNICGPEGPAFSPTGHVLVNTRLSPCPHSGIWVVSSGTAIIAAQVVPPFSTWGEGMVFLTAGPYAGQLIASDSAGGRIVRVPPADFGNLLKAPTTFITGLCVPVGLAVDAQSELFVSDPCRQEIRKYGSDGLFKQVFASGLNGPLFMEFDSNDNLYVAHHPSGQILKFLLNGGRVPLFPGGPLWETNVPQSVGVAIR